MVFRKGGPLATYEKWFIGGDRLEVVREYKYLGMMFSTKLCTSVTLSDLALRARTAVVHMCNSLRKLVHVTPTVFFKILDTQIQPVMLYAAEVWGLDDTTTIETVHILALKKFLNVSVRTPNIMVYGDTGRFPVSVNATIRSVKYWLKILRMDELRLPYQVYKMMLKNVDGRNSWARKVKRVLQSLEMGDIWERQSVSNESLFLKCLRERLIAKYDEMWRNKLDGSYRYVFYRQIKLVRGRENYLYALDKRIVRDIFVRFRFGITDLYVHKFRYCDEGHSTLCPLCNEEDEDEKHFLLECPALYDLRRKYIFRHVHSTSSVLSDLLSAQSENVIRSVGWYLVYAFKRRMDSLVLSVPF